MRFLSVQAANPEQELTQAFPPQHPVLSEGSVCATKLACGISVRARTSVRPLLTGISARQHHSQSTLWACRCGVKDGPCRWGRGSSRGSGQPPWRVPRSAVASCSAVVCAKGANIPRPMFTAQIALTGSGEESGVRGSNVDLLVAWFVRFIYTAGEKPRPQAGCAVLVLGH